VLLPPGGKTRTDVWGTPEELFAALNAEFDFTLDPCPLDPSETAGCGLWGKDSLLESWAGQRVFCNPPYSDIWKWTDKRHEPDVAVYLIPVRSDTAWWHDHALEADEIRFIRGRLKFGGSATSAPFPSAILVFDKRKR